MNLPAVVLGIDIAKLKFDVCLIKENQKVKHKVFANTRHGFEQLVAWLASHQVGSLHICLEATGSYGEALALFLHKAGYMVSVVNPAAVKAFAASRLTRTKTDKVDAELIARFCLAQQPKAWIPPASEVQHLQALVRRLESLIEMRVAEENRLSSGIAVDAVRHSLEAHIAYLVEQIKQTEQMIREHINNHPDLKEQSTLLDSIPGIGQTTAALLLAEIVNIKEYKSARPCCCLRRTCPARAAFRKFGAQACSIVKNRKRPASQSPLLSGNDSFAMQQFLSAMGERNA